MENLDKMLERLYHRIQQGKTDYGDYLLVKSLVRELLYIKESVSTIDKIYNPYFGSDNLCACGHPYYRHFDSYDDNYPVGCKYCECMTWKKPKE
jgi:hypothetical protein